VNKGEFMIMLIRPINELDGVDLHLRNLFKENNADSILYITGLDFTDLLDKVTQEELINPK